jgi:beta-galactosidase
VELLVNGTSAGVKKVPRLSHVEWKVRYAPGSIEARGSKDGKVVLTEKRETTGPASAIRLTADRSAIQADGEDLAILKVEALDSSGRLVPTAGHMIEFKLTGPGAIIGVGNGDPNCQESDKEPQRSLFNGLAQVIVQASKTPGDITIEARPKGSHQQPAKVTVTSKSTEMRPVLS